MPDLFILPSPLPDPAVIPGLDEADEVYDRALRLRSHRRRRATAVAGVAAATLVGLILLTTLRNGNPAGLGITEEPDASRPPAADQSELPGSEAGPGRGDPAVQRQPHGSSRPAGSQGPISVPGPPDPPFGPPISVGYDDDQPGAPCGNRPVYEASDWCLRYAGGSTFAAGSRVRLRAELCWRGAGTGRWHAEDVVEHDVTIDPLAPLGDERWYLSDVMQPWIAITYAQDEHDVVVPAGKCRFWEYVWDLTDSRTGRPLPSGRYRLEVAVVHLPPPDAPPFIGMSDNRMRTDGYTIHIE